MATRIHSISGVRLYFIPVTTRVPLKFGPEVLTSVTCARVALRVVDEQGREAEGWGETPLSVQWVWPSKEPYEPRHQGLRALCRRLAEEWLAEECSGDPLWIGHSFAEHALPRALAAENATHPASEPIPWLAALVCNAAFDLALHDAFGNLVGKPTYATYNPEFMEHDLGDFLQPAESNVIFKGHYPEEFLERQRPDRLPAWHLVGGLDPLADSDLTGEEPQDAYPTTLIDWIRTDGLKCLKVKLRGTDMEWDLERLRAVGKISREHRVERLTADFNCTVKDPAYVCEILDRLKQGDRQTWNMLLYVEQPFPYELEPARIDVHSVASRKPLFLDESAHDWRMIRIGRDLGWTGVALKTCKTQTGAILSACWARAHGMSLMVQDLTNPMLAQIPHVLLAAHVGTIHGVETNSMQFYPAASDPESQVHPGIYKRVDGSLDISTIHGPGFGYRLKEIHRDLPVPAVRLKS